MISAFPIGAMRRLPNSVSYATAATITVLTLAIGLDLDIELSQRPILLLFLAPVIVSACLFGRGPGLLSTSLATAGLAYTLMMPSGGGQSLSAATLGQCGTLATLGALISLLSVRAAKPTAEIALRNSEHYHSLFDNMLEGYAHFRAVVEDGIVKDYVYLEVNPAFKSLTGLGDVVGRRFSEVVPGTGQSNPEVFDICSRVAATGKPERFETYVVALERWFSIAIYSPQKDHFVAVFDNITQRKSSEKLLEHMAYYDPLTGLPNRLLLRHRLDHAAQHARRSGSKLAVLFLDLDNFKVVNDSLGHDAGNQLLQGVAARLREVFPIADTLAHLGRDEFVTVLDDLSSPEEAARVAQNLIGQLQAPFTVGDGSKVYVGGSVGISIFPDDGDDARDLLQHADTAHCRAKDAGRNTYCFYTSAQTAVASHRLSMESSLRHALAHEEFLLHYQPLVALPDGRPVGIEALVRWRKPDGTLIAPNAFIPLAEETGLIVPLGRWVLREACTRMKRWKDQGLDLQTIAVNLSPKQFRQPDLCEMIATTLADTGLPATCLELEITESAIMETGAEAQSRLAELKALGVRLAIDDFGTGYSSLAYLKRFPLDKLKIDQSFVRDIPNDPAGMEITATIIAMARNLNLAVLAEGIETEGQLAFLSSHQCEGGQGFLFSQPVSDEEIERWVGKS